MVNVLFPAKTLKDPVPVYAPVPPIPVTATDAWPPKQSIGDVWVALANS